MEWIKANWKAVAGFAAVAVIVWYVFGMMQAFASPVAAADKAVISEGVADLEERVAELEATAAKKGNRKVSLIIDGQVNAAISYFSIGDYDNTEIVQNGNDRSFVGFTGQARINSDLTAGYRLELDMAQLGLLGAPIGSVNPTTRQSYWFLKSETLGTVAVGKNSVATNDFDKWSTNKSWIAGKPLSLGSLSDLYLTGLDVPFDGNYREVVRYDSPVLTGFILSASWSPSLDIFDSNGNGNQFDIALRYAGDIGKEFKVTAAAGYRRSTDLDISMLNVLNVQIPTGDVDSFLVNGSVMHIPTGIFINASYAHQDYKDLGSLKLQGIDVTAGLEERWFALGKTDVFGTWGQYKVDMGGSADLDYYGMGIVQSIDAAAMDLYVGYRHYNTGDFIGDDADTVTGGGIIRF